jgi:hypothetical protein
VITSSFQGYFQTTQTEKPHVFFFNKINIICNDIMWSCVFVMCFFFKYIVFLILVYQNYWKILKNINLIYFYQIIISTTCLDTRYLVLNFYQINRNDEIRTRNHLVIKTLISCQRIISTQQLKLLGGISGHDLYYFFNNFHVKHIKHTEVMAFKNTLYYGVGWFLIN